mgnify:CR=1 FL=1
MTSTATPHSVPESPQQPRQRLRMRVYDCNDGGPAAAVGLRRVHGVLRAAGFGYGLSDLRQFDVAALLMAEVRDWACLLTGGRGFGGLVGV